VAAGAPPPAGAEVIDCSGMVVIPGLIDVQARAHADRGAARPAQEWRYETALDFGVTTLLDTSAGTTAALPQAERAAVGLQVGPRVLATGDPLLGARSAEEARLHVQRRRAAGAHSIKVHPTAPRTQRQWYAAACRAEGLRCIAEAADTGHALTLLLDGYDIIEHAIPYTPSYADVLSLWAQSGAAAATLLATPDGLQGDNFYFQFSNPIDDPRLLRHHPRRALDEMAWRRAVLARDWSFQSSARDTAALQDAGAAVALGSGGRVQGLGVHWELWAMAGPGAMTPYAALQVATISSARAVGLDHEVGTVEAGKRADLIVLAADPLEDIRSSTQIALVIHDGMLRE
ncbi:MAG: imidazolonepropionase-like amidohydrolase, partial [Myxococcota bacterium]